MSRMTDEAANLAKREITGAAWFPLKTGNLRDNAVSVRRVSSGTEILFSSVKAPHIDYLEYGTGPHDIPGAFGRPLPFGFGGRFAGFFHPGSRIHVWFISRKAVDLSLDCALRVCSKYYKVVSHD